MNPYVTQYQSANLSDEQIIDNFIVRTMEFERVMAGIRTTDKDSSFQHYVFVGRRGSGKSTLLRRIQAEVGTDQDLKDRFIVTNLSEEQAGIYKLYDLWDYVMRDLRAKGFSLPEIDWQEYQEDLKEYTKVLYAAIHEFLQKQDKRLILLVDNIDRIFKNIGKHANLLREQLMNYNDVRIIGASTIMSEEFWRYDMPFYQFFSIKRLEPLTMEEIKMLLEHWAKVKRNPEIAKLVERHPGKIQALRMLTDGTPRTMQLFVDMLIHRSSEQGFDYLRRIIDNATPIYQERLGQLSQQQQKIVVELSFFWEAASVEQLVPVCKMSGKNISAQMSHLLKEQIVESIKGLSKNNLYRIHDRFWGLWLIMTQGGIRHQEMIRKVIESLELLYGESVEDEPISEWHQRQPSERNYAAEEPKAKYNQGIEHRRRYLFAATHRWKDAREEAVGLYLGNKNPKTALARIREACKWRPDDEGLLAIQNVIQLWAGRMEEYSQNALPLMTEMNRNNSVALQSYVIELLIHKQYNTVSSAFKAFETEATFSFHLFRFVLDRLQGGTQMNSLRMPPEFEKSTSMIVEHIVKRQEFYYGK